MSELKPALQPGGVHHTTFLTWKSKSMLEFYCDGLGLKLLHAIIARGWGRRDGHPNFLHFFFDAGNGAAIAFFYYIDTRPHPDLIKIRGYLGEVDHDGVIAEFTLDRLRIVAPGA